MTQEDIYDRDIDSLMARILAICKEHKIAMIASFSLDGVMCCTSALLTDDYDAPDSFMLALAAIKPPDGTPLHITTRDNDGVITRVETIL